MENFILKIKTPYLVIEKNLVHETKIQLLNLFFYHNFNFDFFPPKGQKLLTFLRQKFSTNAPNSLCVYINKSYLCFERWDSLS